MPKTAPLPKQATLPFPDPVKSLAEVDAALAELGRLDALEQAAAARMQLAIKRAKEQAATKLTVEVDGRELAFADRRAELEEVISMHCAAHKAELLGEGPGKTVKLNHGAIAWRKTPDKLVPVEGGSAAGSATVLDRVVAAIVAALKALKIAGNKVCSATLLRPSVVFDREAILAAYKRADLTDVQLARLGFDFMPGEDELLIKPAKHFLESQSGADT